MSSVTLDAESFSRARTAMRGMRENEFGVLEAVAGIDVAGTGYPSLARLLEDLFHVDRRDARRLVRHAEALLPRAALTGEALPPRAPATAAVAAGGEIGPGHVDVVLTTLERLAHLPAPILAEAEATLAEAATHLPPRALAKVADRLIATLDPDGAAPDDDDAPADELLLGTRRDGALNGKFRFHSAADRELVREVLDALSTPAGPDDPRSLATRQAEAFLDLVAQAASPTGIASPTHGDDGLDGVDELAFDDDDPHDDRDGPGSHALNAEPGPGPDAGPDPAQATAPRAAADAESGAGPSARSDAGADTGDAAPPGQDGDEAGRPTPAGPRAGAGRDRPPVRAPGRGMLTLTMDLRWLRDETGHGTLESESAISPAEARRIACDAGIVPMVLGTRSEPLDVGRLSYTVPEGMRRALIVRDGGCAFPGCTRRHGRCASHHVVHWADGGATGLHNLALLCRYHHRLIHQDQWHITMRDGRPWFVPPRWIDPERTPRPGGRQRFEK